MNIVQPYHDQAAPTHTWKRAFGGHDRNGNVHCRREGIIGTLESETPSITATTQHRRGRQHNETRSHHTHHALVHMIVRVHRRLGALDTSQHLNRSVGDDFVHVHVGLRARTGLERALSTRHAGEPSHPTGSQGQRAHGCVCVCVLLQQDRQAHTQHSFPHTSKKLSRCFPARISSAAAMMTSARRPSRTPSPKLTRALHFFTMAMAGVGIRMQDGGAGTTEPPCYRREAHATGLANATTL